MQLSRIPRLRLAFLPTPLAEMPHLSRLLNGPQLLIKRDDMTGLALGGNKARKLEYLLGAAQAAGATAVLTTAGVYSNYLRMTAAGARKAGMRPILFMRGTGQEAVQGNVLLNEILGAELRFIDITDPWSPAGQAIMEDAARELAAQGESPFVITVQTTHAPLAALGYVRAALELYQQTLERDITVDWIVCPTGSGVTQAGLILGAKLLQWPVRIVGIAGAPGTAAAHRERIPDIIDRAAHLLGVAVQVTDEEVIVDDDYAGAGYGQATPGVVRAIRLLGETEGLILDPVYSGKTMHGLLEWVAQGRLARPDTVVFLHTGGAPNLFTQAETLGQALRQERAAPVP